MIEAICAISENNCLGANGKTPWHYAEDLAFFKSKTIGHAVVMGRTTYNSLSHPLINRTNYVLTHKSLTNSNAIPFTTKETILNLNTDCFIIGGNSVFEMFKNDIQRWYITNIPGKYDGNVFFNPSLLNNFSIVETTPLKNNLVVKIYERNR